MNAFNVARASRIIRSGGVIAHATEGVWGLACNALDRAAVRRVLSIKRRAMDKGLIVIGACADDFAPELDPLPPDAREAIVGAWPGAVSWVVPNVRFPVEVTGRRSTVAIRVPGHEQARSLCRAVGQPLVSTSANRSGQPAPLSELQVRSAVGGEVDYVLAGETSGRRGPSEVKAWQGAVFRAGGTVG